MAVFWSILNYAFGLERRCHIYMVLWVSVVNVGDSDECFLQTLRVQLQERGFGWSMRRRALFFFSEDSILELNMSRLRSTTFERSRGSTVQGQGRKTHFRYAPTSGKP